MFVFKSNKPYCVEFDLFEGYFQNHIHKDDWSYLAVETPFKGLRILTRSGQGLLNQEIEMNNLLAKILGEEIEKGNVMVQADDGQVGGKSIEETIDNWIRTLNLCSRNNIKLNFKKIKILPEESLIHGWIFKIPTVFLKSQLDFVMNLFDELCDELFVLCWYHVDAQNHRDELFDELCDELENNRKW